jgi:hypothetical protein
MGVSLVMKSMEVTREEEDEEVDLAVEEEEVVEAAVEEVEEVAEIDEAVGEGILLRSFSASSMSLLISDSGTGKDKPTFLDGKYAASSELGIIHWRNTRSFS